MSWQPWNRTGDWTRSHRRSSRIMPASCAPKVCCLVPSSRPRPGCWPGAGAHGSGPAKRTTGPRSPPSWTRWSGWRGRRPPPSAPRPMRTIPCWTSMRKAWMHPRSHPCSTPSRSASTASWTDAMPTSRPRSSMPPSTRDGFMSCAFPSSGVWAMTNRGGWFPSPLIRSPACSAVTT